MAEWKQKRQHMHHYNHTSHIYNTRYTEEQNLKIKAVVENIELNRESSILDLGCGTGLLLPKIQKTAKTIVGLDISKNMLKEITPYIKRSPNIHLTLADADHTPLRDNYFDTVFAITLLQNMPTPLKTLQETKRITKPNATIIITGLKKHFTQHSFTKLLKNSKLKTKPTKRNNKLKCHTAICKKE